MSQHGGSPHVVPADDIEDADPVLARERTDLAWTRSAISFLALGVAILKFRPVVGIPLLAFSAVVWLIGRPAPARGQPGSAPAGAAGHGRRLRPGAGLARAGATRAAARLGCGPKLTQIACSAR